MLIIDHYNTTFIHNPKTGGSSIREWISRIPGSNIGYEIGHHHGISKNNIKGLSFCCIRNTYEKMVSTYLHLYHIRSKSFNFGSSFDQFLGFIEEKKPSPWANSQLFYTEHADYIIRFENIHEDFKLIQDRFCCYRPLFKCNENKYNKYWKEYYTESNRKRVEKMYQEDIDTFGYKF